MNKCKNVIKWLVSLYKTKVLLLFFSLVIFIFEITKLKTDSGYFKEKLLPIKCIIIKPIIIHIILDLLLHCPKQTNKKHFKATHYR